MKKASLYSLIIVMSFLSACSMPTITRLASNEAPNTSVIPGIHPQAISSTDSTITLEWDYYTVIPVESFNLYYKAHSEGNWILVDTIVYSLTPEFTIDHSQMGNGSWDFGITAVDSEGIESDKHSSLDHTASPATGWYLIWDYN